jgi:topoisomerase-4 subunit A
VLLNGASGIAVGLATEVPSHNLREVAAATVALLKNDKLSDDELHALLPAPDFPGGGQIISPVADIREAYRTGRGSLKLRARWIIEDLARGQWQLVVTELPPLHQHAEGAGRDRGDHQPQGQGRQEGAAAEQVQLKQSLLAVLDAVRDESSKDAPVRLVFEPKSRTVEQAELITALLAHTSLESSVPLNLTMVGIDGRPVLKGLRRILVEWIEFRQATVARRTRHRLAKVLDRIHVLEGRQLVLLNIDEVIRIIRNADEPKPALIARFALSDRQAEDILDIRLRQLARLEAIKIEQELKELRTEQGKLEDILASPAALKRTVIKEIEADAKNHGDERRTLIQEEKKAVAEVKVLDEPGDRGRQPQGLGACAQGPRAGPGHADLQVRRCAVRLFCLPQRGHPAGLWQQRQRVYSVAASLAAGRPR